MQFPAPSVSCRGGPTAILGQFASNLRTSSHVTPGPVQYVAEPTRHAVSAELPCATHHVRHSGTNPNYIRPNSDSARQAHEAAAACPTAWAEPYSRFPIVNKREFHTPTASVPNRSKGADCCRSRTRQPPSPLAADGGPNAGCDVAYSKTVWYNGGVRSAHGPQNIQKHRDHYFLPAPGDGTAPAPGGEGGGPHGERVAPGGHPPLHGGAGVARQGANSAAFPPREQQRRRMHIHLSKSGYKTREPENLDPPLEPPERLFNLAKLHMTALEYSRDEMLELLAINAGDFQEYYHDPQDMLTPDSNVADEWRLN